MELGCLVFVGLRTKVHLQDKSYTWVSETKDFTEDSCEEFGRSWVSGFALRGRDSFYFGLFSIIGAVWLSFNALRGCLEK